MTQTATKVVLPDPILLARDKAKADAALTALRFSLSRKSSVSIPPVRKL
jgi:hypothetical protein